MESTPRMQSLVDQRGEPVDSVRTEEKTEVQQKKEEKPCKTTVEDLQKVFPNTSSIQLKQVADLINHSTAKILG